MEVLSKGSIESLLVPVRDRLNNIEDLTEVSDLKFDTRAKLDDATCQTNANVALDSDYPMTAICEIDTTLPAYVPGEEYKLYLKYVAGSEHPILGPIYFRVESD